MSTSPPKFFYETFSEYVQPYMAACEEPATRAQILDDCVEAVYESPLYNMEELPENLHLEIFKQFMSYLDDDDRGKEEARLGHFEETGEYLTPEDREAAARPQNAGEYRKPFNAQRAAVLLWSDEVAQLDESRNKADKRSIGEHTKTVQKWLKELSADRLAEAKKAAEKWNALGCPDERKMFIYRKKHLMRLTNDFLDTIRRTMGVYSIVFHGYVSSEDKNGEYYKAYMETSGYSFKNFSADTGDWIMNGVNFFDEYLTSRDKDPEDQEGPTDQIEKEQIPEVGVDDISGHPILPTRDAMSSLGLKSQQAVVREVFSKAYARVTRSRSARVPWLALGKGKADLLDAETIPEDFKVLDPSKLTKNNVTKLLSHWRERETSDQPILIFNKAQEQDKSGGYFRGREPSLMTKKRAADTYDEFDGGDSNDESGSDKDEGPSGSKRPRLSEQPGVPEEDSPAANIENKSAFLLNLTKENSYNSFMFRSLELPEPASSESSSSEAQSLPAWASWDWPKKYLSEDIHIEEKEFEAALDLLKSYRFADSEQGSLVTLGFGLLLRECWRAIKAEKNNQDTPQLLRESCLREEMVVQVNKAIEEAMRQIPPEERRSTAASSKQSRTKKGSAAKRPPSQRVRVATKKVLDNAD